MKMNNRLIVAAIAVVFFAGNIFTVTNAQSAKVTTKWEANFNPNLQKKNVYDSYLGEDENAYYLLVRKLVHTAAGVEYAIEKYNKKNLQPVSSKSLEDFKMLIKSVFVVGDETYARVYENPPAYFKVTKDPQFGIYRFDKNKMTFESISKRFSVDFKDFTNLYTSPDKSKILLVFKEHSKKKEDDKYRFLVVNNQLEKLWEKQISAPVISSFAMDNAGNVYVTFKELHSNSKKDKTAYDYVVMKLSDNDEKRFVMNMNNSLYHECQLQTNKNNDLLVIGFYTDRANEEKTGNYYFSMSKNFDAAENISYQEIPLKILNLYEKKKKLHERYDNYEFGEPLYSENGNVVVCVEENTSYSRTSSQTYGWVNHSQGGSPGATTYSSVSTGTSGGMTTSSTSVKNKYYDIYAFKISEDNKLAWVKRVPKNQQSSDTDKTAYAPQLSDRLSYLTFLSGDNVIVVFSDNVKVNMDNNESSETVKLAYGKDCGLVSVTLNKDGGQMKKIVDTGSLKNDKLDPEVKTGMLLSNNSAIIPARKKTSSKIGILSVE